MVGLSLIRNQVVNFSVKTVVYVPIRLTILEGINVSVLLECMKESYVNFTVGYRKMKFCT